jgi:hypothetical protein
LTDVELYRRGTAGSRHVLTDVELYRRGTAGSRHVLTDVEPAILGR